MFTDRNILGQGFVAWLSIQSIHAFRCQEGLVILVIYLSDKKPVLLREYKRDK